MQRKFNKDFDAIASKSSDPSHQTLHVEVMAMGAAMPISGPTTPISSVSATSIPAMAVGVMRCSTALACLASSAEGQNFRDFLHPTPDQENGAGCSSPLKCLSSSSRSYLFLGYRHLFEINPRTLD
tara:strand:+ start:841 stop:1218 length:378 start_codon:yes stop_codon:yes gene_type:complete